MELKPGDIVKMRGTRDGAGYRKILREDRESYVCMQLGVCHKRDYTANRGPVAVEVGSFVLYEIDQITTHMKNKIHSILTPEMRFVKC